MNYWKREDNLPILSKKKLAIKLTGMGFLQGLLDLNYLTFILIHITYKGSPMKTLTVLGLLSFSSLSLAQLHLQVPSLVKARQNVEFTQLANYDGRLEVAFKAIGKVKIPGGLFPETRAKAEATKAAKMDSAFSVGTVCSGGFNQYRNQIDFFDKECHIEDDHAVCQIKGQTTCAAGDAKEIAYAQADSGIVSPSTGCVSRFKASYDLSQKLVDACNTIETKVQFYCSNILAQYNSVKILSVNACSAYENQVSVDLLNEYAESYGTPKPNLTILLAAVDTEKEINCVSNKMAVGSFYVEDIEEKCIEDSPLELDEREFNAFGFVLKPRTAQYGISKPIEEAGSNLVDRIRGFFN